MSKISEPLATGGGGLGALPATGVFEEIQAAVAIITEATIIELTVANLTVTSGANIPAFDTLTINPSGEIVVGTGILEINTVEGAGGDGTIKLGKVIAASGIFTSLAVNNSVPSGETIALLPHIPAVAISGQSVEWLQITTDQGIRYIPVWG